MKDLLIVYISYFLRVGCVGPHEWGAAPAWKDKNACKSCKAAHDYVEGCF